MTQSFHRLLLSELRMAVYRPGDPAALTDELLCKAVTLNENLRALLDRRERLTNPELALVLESAPACEPERLQKLKVRFKENLDLLFPLLMKKAEGEIALCTLHMLCQHTGDVLRCAEDYIRARRYHLRTCEKKRLVKLLESYPVGNLRQNLMKSLRIREHSLMVLNYLDYNRFSRSPAHREAVRALRNGELLFWHSVGEALLKAQDARALPHLAEHPGYMLRMLNRLLSLGYSEEAITAALLPRAEALSGHLMVRVVRTLSTREKMAAEKYALQKQALERELNFRLASAELGQVPAVYRSRIADCEARYDASLRELEPDQKRARRLEACRQEAEKRRRDLRMEYLEGPKEEAWAAAFAQHRALKEELDRAREELAALEDFMRGASDVKPGCILRDANHAFDAQRTQFLLDPKPLQDQLARLEARVAFLSAAQKREFREARRRFSQRCREIELANEPACTLALQETERWARETREAIEREYARNLLTLEEDRQRLAARREEEIAALRAEMEDDIAEAEQKRREIQAEFQKKQAMLAGSYAASVRMSAYDPAAVRILKALLRAHFRQVSTPLRGKAVCCRLEAFDLRHSTLETEDRSRDGGYIRSGIAFKIPEKARFVRFFVYWNDQQRVDVDLHAGGLGTDGESLHIGWNGDCQNCGVIHSGDITHSDAAEYIDVDLSAPIKEIYANIHLFSGAWSFRELDTCYVGLMAVDKPGQTVRHYDPANCFFTHALTQDVTSLHYGFIDVENRCVRFVGQTNPSTWDGMPEPPAGGELFSLQDYLDCVLEGQGVRLVEKEEEADLILTMGKSLSQKGLSLVDSNFFLES